MYDGGEGIQNVCRFANHADLKTTDSFELGGGGVDV